MSTEKMVALVRGHRMTYLESGEGELVVFLHGNPTSSFLWRNIVAPLSTQARCVAPDLIGMGDSDKLEGEYSFFEHRAFLDELLARFEGPLVLVVHDWGSALGFDWARRHPERVRGIVHMESIVGQLRLAESPAPVQALFARLRSAEGERLVLDDNGFVEGVLPAGIERTLSTDEMEEYRRPFRERAARRPTLAWPRALPIDGTPADVSAVVAEYTAWLAGSDVPKLFVNVEPGRMVTDRLRAECRRWPNQREVTVRGLHYVQEDSPAAIASAISTFLRELPR